MTKLLILHLSDIHIRSAADEVLNRVEKIAAATFQHLPSADALMIAISGDLSFSGNEEQFKVVQSLVEALVAALKREAPSLRAEVFVCPGNHDCDFSLNDETREAVLARVRSLDGLDPSPSLVKTAVSLQARFFDFRNRISQHRWEVDTPLAWQTRLTLKGKRIGVRSLNVAWMSELKEKQGALIYPASAVAPFLDDEVDLSITLLHHPFTHQSVIKATDLELSEARW